MDDSSKLYEIFEGIIGEGRVYIDPPDNLSMEYPCIRISRDARQIRYANGKKYSKTSVFTVTLIDYDSDSEFFEPIEDLEHCEFDRQYGSEGLFHFVFNKYI